MKKLLLCMVMLVSVGLLFAATTSGINTAATATGDGAEIKVSVNTSGINKVIVGFTNAEVTDGDFSEQTATYGNGDENALVLTTTDTGTATNSEKPLFVFWQIQSANSVKVDLGATPLTGTKNAGNKLGLTIKSGESDVLTVASTDSAKTTEDGAIHIHNGSSAMGTAGSKPLTLTTTSYADFPGDTFTGTITVTVTVDDAAEAVEEG